MRLAELRLEKYGPFEHLTLALDPAPGRINLITAPNGAGKSVLRQAFSDLLFGIPARSALNFRYGYAEMRISAKALLGTGETLEFTRRKGLGTTLLDAQGAALEPARLGMLPDSATFERLFALDTALLRKGGDDLLKSGGSVADALLAAQGLPGARQLARDLLEESKTLTYIRKDAQSPLNQAATALRQASSAAKESLLRPKDHERARTELARAADTLAKADAAQKAASARLEELTRLRAARPHLRAIDAALAWAQSNPNAPTLADDLGTRLEQAEAAYQQAATRAEAATAQAAQLRAQLAGITEQPGLLAAAAAIETLAGPAGAAAEALADSAGLAAELALAEADVARLEAEAGTATLPQAALRSAALSHLARLEALEHAATEASAALTARETELAKCQQALAAEPDTPEAEALAALLREIRAEGDPARRLHTAQAACAEAAAALAEAQAQLPVPEAGLAALEAPLHPAPHYAAIHAQLSAARTAQTQAEAALQTATTRRQQAQARRTEAERAAPAATASTLQAARAHRDAGITLTLRLADGEAVPPAELASFTGPAPLPAALREAVTQADHLADARAANAEALARLESAQTQLAQEQASESQAQTVLDQAKSATAAALAAWQSLLPPCLPASAELETLQAFLASRAAWLAARTRHSTAQAALLQLQAEQAGHATRIHALLQAATLPQAPENQPSAAAPPISGRQPPGGSAPPRNLATALQAADQHLIATALRQRSRASLQGACQQAESALAQARDKAGLASQILAQWHANWQPLAAELGRPATEPPSLTAAILARQADLATARASAQTLQSRLHGIQTRAQAFQTQLAQTLSACGPDAPTPNATDPLEAALATHARLKSALATAQATHTRAQTLRQQLQTATDAEAETQAALTRAQHRLDQLLAEAQAPTQEAARAAIALSQTRGQHETSRQAAETELATLAPNIQPHTLRAALAALADPEAAEAEAHSQLQSATAARDTALLKHAELARALEATEASTAYAQAIAQTHVAAAAAGATLADAALLRLASHLLTEAMARFEAQSQPALLARIAAIFAGLTEGAFPALGIDHTTLPPSLILHHAGPPREEKHIAALSEGTRDQLFLAFRLAALAEHPARLPFVADDILQSFDDARAEAALHALLELSHTTQVILLTHHRHIAALARSLPPGSLAEADLHQP